MNPFYEKRDGRIQISISENMSFPAHLHGDVEILYCLSGKIMVTVMEDSKVIEEGGCAVIFPERVHSYAAEENCRTLLIIFGASAAGPYAGNIRKLYPENPFLNKKEISGDAGLALRRLCREEVIKDDRLCGAWIQVLLAHFFKKIVFLEAEGPENLDLTCRLVQYIMEHFQEPLTLEGLAAKLHVNKYYLSHTFSGRLQMNFKEYLNRIRLEYAVQLIRTTDKPLMQIGAEAGFESQRSFNRVFADILGTQPKEFRNHRL